MQFLSCIIMILSKVKYFYYRYKILLYLIPIDYVIIAERHVTFVMLSILKQDLWICIMRLYFNQISHMLALSYNSKKKERRREKWKLQRRYYWIIIAYFAHLCNIFSLHVHKNIIAHASQLHRISLTHFELEKYQAEIYNSR